MLAADLLSPPLSPSMRKMDPQGSKKYKHVYAMMKSFGIEHMKMTCSENGLDSMMLSQLIAQVKQEFGVEVSLNDVLGLSVEKLMDLICSSSSTT